MSNINYIILGSDKFINNFKIEDKEHSESKLLKFSWKDKNKIPSIIDNHRIDYKIIAERYDKFLDDTHNVFEIDYEIYKKN